MWYFLWILAGIGDPLPDLEHHSFSFNLMQESPTSTDMTVTPTNSTTTACETFISDPIPTPTPLRRSSSHCLYPNRYYLGLESPAGLRWLQSPAITAMPGRSTSKKRVCPPDVSEVDSDPTFPGLIGLGNCNYFVWVSIWAGEQLNPPTHTYTLCHATILSPLGWFSK